MQLIVHQQSLILLALDQQIQAVHNLILLVDHLCWHFRLEVDIWLIVRLNCGLQLRWQFLGGFLLYRLASTEGFNGKRCIRTGITFHIDALTLVFLDASF